MNLLTLIGLSLFLSINTMSAHDIHVSVAELEIKKDGQLEVSLRIFFDDLLMACGLTPGEELPEGYENSDELIAEYVGEHFKLFVNGKQVPLTYEDSFSDNLAVWIELKNSTIQLNQIKDVELENTILFKEFDDQLNILNCTGEHLGASHTFNHKNPRKSILK